MQGRSPIRVLVAVMAVGALAGVAEVRGATPEERREARKVIAPMNDLRTGLRSRRAAIRSELSAWQKRTTPCVANFVSDFAIAPQAEELIELRAAILVTEVTFDGLVHSLAPAADLLTAAERRWGALAKRRGPHRELARLSARGLVQLRGYDGLDTCAFYSEWRSTGFDPTRLPAPAAALIEDQEGFPLTRWRRGMGRLRPVVGTRVADRFELVPLTARIISFDALLTPIDAALPGYAESLDLMARSQARNAVSYVNSCFAGTEDYRKCDSEREIREPDLDYGIGPAQVSVLEATRDTFSVEAVSTYAAGDRFTRFGIRQTRSGRTIRRCTPAGQGECPRSGRW